MNPLCIYLLVVFNIIRVDYLSDVNHHAELIFYVNPLWLPVFHRISQSFQVYYKRRILAI